MFIDYLSLLLVNMAAGFLILAVFLCKGLSSAQKKDWVPAFVIVGLVAFICGLHLIWIWPLPGSYNSAFGETSVLFGVLFLGAALALAKGYELYPLGIYSLFAGIAAVVIGARIINLGMTKEPLVSGAGFILSGLSGIGVLPALFLRNRKPVVLICAFFLIVAAILWACTGLFCYWGHMESFAKWVPGIIPAVE